jgi:hypothetical protein
MMKKIIFIFFLVLLPVAALAADQTSDRPHWSLELKGGLFYPALSDWKQYYGSDKTDEYDLALAYKFTRRLEAGIEGGYSRSGGQGVARLHGVNAGHVVYNLYPVNVFVLYRGIVNEDQWLVPYIGGGFTRMYYQEKVDFQGSAKGHADGYHARAGLQFLLDGLDPSAANSFYLDDGVYHTYFFIEARYSRAMIDTSSGSLNLGGKSYLAGLLFEF